MKEEDKEVDRLEANGVFAFSCHKFFFFYVCVGRNRDRESVCVCE